MSAVIINGDTSGSVTLQAPAVAGSTTLTLPATSGTVLTTTSGQWITTGSNIYYNTGNVGIGTTSPSSRLVVGAGVSTERIQINAGSGWADLSLKSANTNGGSIYWNNGTTDKGEIFYYHVSDYMSFKTNATERMRITSIGNVGIGTSTPTGALSITTGQNASIVTTGPGAHGRMLGKFFTNGGSAKTLNLLTIDSFNTANTRVFVNVTIRWVNAIGDQGGTATAWAGASQGGTRTQGAFVASQTWGASVLGSLSWSGNTLRITTPSLSFIGGFIDVEYVSFDGANVTLDSSNQ